MGVAAGVLPCPVPVPGAGMCEEHGISAANFLWALQVRNISDKVLRTAAPRRRAVIAKTYVFAKTYVLEIGTVSVASCNPGLEYSVY